MAETLAMILGTVNGGSLKSIGFVNPPTGTWNVMSGSKKIDSSNRATNIPLVVESISRSGSVTSGKDSASRTHAYFTVNGVNLTDMSGWANGYHDQGGYAIYLGFNYSGSAKHIFIASAFGMDLSKCQNYDCTASVWLEKK